MAKFRVILKGEADPIILSFQEGQKLSDDLAAGRVTGMLKIAGNLVSVGAIKAILPEYDNSVAVVDASDKRAKEDRDWNTWKTNRIAMSPKERARSTNFFDMISSALRGRRLTELEKADVRFAQEVYFTEHLDAHVANPRCYFTQEDISRAQATLPRNNQDTSSMKQLMPKFVLDFSERHLLV